MAVEKAGTYLLFWTNRLWVCGCTVAQSVACPKGPSLVQLNRGFESLHGIGVRKNSLREIIIPMCEANAELSARYGRKKKGLGDGACDYS